MVLYRVLIIFDNLTNDNKSLCISWQQSNYTESITQHSSGTARTLTNPIAFSAKLTDFAVSCSLGIMITVRESSNIATMVNIFNASNQTRNSQVARVLSIGYIN